MNFSQHIPTLRSVGKLAGMRPVIVTDTREQTPLRFANLESLPGTLVSGNYAPKRLKYVCAIERKSAADLVASVSPGGKVYRIVVTPVTCR
jgi:ERCC4-type nuclease